MLQNYSYYSPKTKEKKELSAEQCLLHGIKKKLSVLGHSFWACSYLQESIVTNDVLAQ
jgi:hypothetical protein